MSKRSASSLSVKKMVAPSKGRNEVISCSTPEPDADSPSRDSDSICDSEAASPVPFLCTQDGTDADTDVVWNYYTPKSEHTAKSRLKNSTPLSRKPKRTTKKPVLEKPIARRRPLRSTQKKSELFQDLLELNQNIHKLIEKKPELVESVLEQAESEEDILSNSSDYSPKSGLRSEKRCLRKNLLSSKFNKPECDTALESDDSMNECLITASQIIEEKIIIRDQVIVQTSANNLRNTMNGVTKLESPLVTKNKKYDSPGLKNDSFDNLIGNLNDSALEHLTQMPIKNVTPVRNSRYRDVGSTSDWTMLDLKVYESPSKSFFGRHSSMPESPTVVEAKKPSTSGTVFGRYNSMPYNNKKGKDPEPGDSPIRCTPEEIKKKHLQAREKLLAKRLLPFTAAQQPSQTQHLLQSQSALAPRKACFRPKVATNADNNRVAISTSSCHSVHSNSTSASSNLNGNNRNNASNTKQNINNSTNLKLLIEKKRQEALMKLKRKQSH